MWRIRRGKSATGIVACQAIERIKRLGAHHTAHDRSIVIGMLEMHEKVDRPDYTDIEDTDLRDILYRLNVLDYKLDTLLSA